MVRSKSDNTTAENKNPCLCILSNDVKHQRTRKTWSPYLSILQTKLELLYCVTLIHCNIHTDKMTYRKWGTMQDSCRFPVFYFVLGICIRSKHQKYIKRSKKTHIEWNFNFNNNNQKQKQPIPSYVFGGNKASIS